VPVIAKEGAADRRRQVVAMITDPRNIAALLGLGGLLMVAGLIIFLWANDYFTPPVVALTLGLANAGVLLGGWSTIRYSRYQLAGRALTLLACLVMPLNLWYYHTRGLVTIEGHLWLAALAISGLYAASALILEDELFVYVFSAGIAMTGLLILADLKPSPEKFWEIARPSTLLVVLGLIGIHLERAFPIGEGCFSRRRFGAAFFRSGHALMIAGLLLVLGAQIAADWLYKPIFHVYYEKWQALPTPMVTQPWGQVLALCLILAGTYAYLYSAVVARRGRAFIYFAAAMVCWAEVQALEVLHIRLGLDVLIATLAGTGLMASAIEAQKRARMPQAPSFAIVGFLFSVAALVIGLLVYGQALSPDLKRVWQQEPPVWTYVYAMLLTAAACRYGAHVNRKSQPLVATAGYYATAAALMVAGVAALAALHLTQWEQHAPILMTLPIAYLVAARFCRGQPTEEALVGVAHAAAAVMLISGVSSAFEGFTHIVEKQWLNVMLSVFFAEAALFYGLAAIWRKHLPSIHMATAMACASLWQILTYFGVQGETYTLTFAVVGLGLLIAHRIATAAQEATSRLAEASFRSANTLLIISFVAALLMGASRIASSRVQWSFVGLSLTLAAISLLAVMLVQAGAWRRWYIVMAISQGLLTAVAIQMLSQLTVYQKLEIFSVASGLALLIAGHIGWYREDVQESETVTASLFLGSLLAGIPLAAATIYNRWNDRFLLPDEMGFLLVGILLLSTGFIFQLKSTTLVGAGLTALYWVMLLVYVPWKELNSLALIIGGGGAVVFASGLLLSIYRDRLLALPEKIHKRSGIFQVLNWR
jgi:hypothetical protein